MSNTIYQEVLMQATPQRIFEALTDAKQFSAVTGLPAEIEAVTGGQFSCFGGMITGLTIEAIAAKRLVQVWRVGNWDDGIYSLIKFEFKSVNDAETKIIFEQCSFPDAHREHLEQGWHDRYWGPLKKYLSK